jgi:hypothetical protein
MIIINIISIIVKPKVFSMFYKNRKNLYFHYSKVFQLLGIFLPKNFGALSPYIGGGKKYGGGREDTNLVPVSPAGIRCRAVLIISKA